MKKKINDLDTLQEIFESLNNGKCKLALSLLDEAKFMKETLIELQARIKEGGVVTSMCQGNYDIDRANPALQAYNTTIKNYNTTIKQLNDMIPADTQVVKGDGFDGFGDET